jgi:hypothetical protein
VIIIFFGDFFIYFILFLYVFNLMPLIVENGFKLRLKLVFYFCHFSFFFFYYYIESLGP